MEPALKKILCVYGKDCEILLIVNFTVFLFIIFL